MTLDDAINYYDGIAKEYRANTEIERNDYMDFRDGTFEVEQLASWLNELKLLRERIEKQPEPFVDAVPRTSIEYICRKNTVSTNPYEHKYHDKFIQFMDDPEISDFGRWQHSNGFNTALVAVKCDLDKVPSVTPKQRWIPCSEKLPYAEYGESDTVLTTCGYRDVEDSSVRWIRLLYFNGGNWCYPTGETYEAKVYAWMPLQEPYRGEGGE